MKFELKAPFVPTGDQPAAIEKLVDGLKTGKDHQVLLGVTGSGKTFTMANVIEKVQMPTLIIAHNKTLAAQLYQEFRDFFPNNAVSYFVSYYDYYQPEAYIPSSDTYIEKEATINDEIDKLRLATTANLLTRPDTIVVSSVSCIYNLGSPVEYSQNNMELMVGEVISRETLLLQLSNLQYQRSDADLKRGTFRLRGDIIQVWPAYEDIALKIETLENKITSIHWIDPVTGSPTLPPRSQAVELDTAISSPNPAGAANFSPRRFTIYPAKHYILNQDDRSAQFAQIEADLNFRIKELQDQGKVVEAYRLKQKVGHDIDMLKELGFVNGIENYSRYFDGRQPGQAPFTLLDHFVASAERFNNGKYLTFVDESHITLPQVRGMNAGDSARKTTLIDYGFRLPSALDNRPLKQTEFMQKLRQAVYVSATPEAYEVSLAGGETVEQLIRPTGLVDPPIVIRPTIKQIEDLVVEVIARKNIGQRTLVTTLTKRMAEALTEYLNDQDKIKQLVRDRLDQVATQKTYDTSETLILADGLLPVENMEIGKIPDALLNASQHLTPLPDIDALQFPKVAYLHSDIETLERSDILDDLRRGEYDVVVGINLLREGLDLPEVSLVAILDADKEGFLRSRTSLIQTMGRAARHENGQVILYADILTKSMKAAIMESQRRRTIQIEHNLAQGITPQGINKPLRERMLEKKEEDEPQARGSHKGTKEDPEPLIVNLNKGEQIDLNAIKPADLTPSDKQHLVSKLKRRMQRAASELDYELAAILRDTISTLE
jgi:excinuclease ABC subunit B